MGGDDVGDDDAKLVETESGVVLGECKPANGERGTKLSF